MVTPPQCKGGWFHSQQDSLYEASPWLSLPPTDVPIGQKLENILPSGDQSKVCAPLPPPHRPFAPGQLSETPAVREKQR